MTDEKPDTRWQEAMEDWGIGDINEYRRWAGEGGENKYIWLWAHRAIKALGELTIPKGIGSGPIGGPGAQKPGWTWFSESKLWGFRARGHDEFNFTNPYPNTFMIIHEWHEGFAPSEVKLSKIANYKRTHIIDSKDSRKLPGAQSTFLTGALRIYTIYFVSKRAMWDELPPKIQGDLNKGQINFENNVISYYKDEDVDRNGNPDKYEYTPFGGGDDLPWWMQIDITSILLWGGLAVALGVLAWYFLRRSKAETPAPVVIEQPAPAPAPTPQVVVVK